MLGIGSPLGREKLTPADWAGVVVKPGGDAARARWLHGRRTKRSKRPVSGDCEPQSSKHCKTHNARQCLSVAVLGWILNFVKRATRIAPQDNTDSVCTRGSDQRIDERLTIIQR